jgi:CcmD family protein
MNRLFVTLALFMLTATAVTAQGEAPASVAGADKSMVVIGVISAIFIGIAVYLFILDRRITRLEKERKNNA